MSYDERGTRAGNQDCWGHAGRAGWVCWLTATGSGRGALNPALVAWPTRGWRTGSDRLFGTLPARRGIGVAIRCRGLCHPASHNHVIAAGCAQLHRLPRYRTRVDHVTVPLAVGGAHAKLLPGVLTAEIITLETTHNWCFVCGISSPRIRKIKDEHRINQHCRIYSSSNEHLDCGFGQRSPLIVRFLPVI